MNLHGNFNYIYNPICCSVVMININVKSNLEEKGLLQFAIVVHYEGKFTQELKTKNWRNELNRVHGGVLPASYFPWLVQRAFS